MSRASQTQGAASPAPRRPPALPALETVLALSLCIVVVFASVAFLGTSRALSRTILELHPDLPASPLSNQERFLQATSCPPLVILVSLDTLRADRLDLYGYERETAPELRALGEAGAVFTTVVAQSSQTLTSYKSLFTGKYPSTLMLEQTGADLLTLAAIESPRDYLVSAFSAVRGLLASSLAERGYRTAAFTDGAWMGKETGFDHGFEVFDASGGGLEAILPRALAWLQGSAAATSFLFVHAYDIHCPYPCREPYNSAFCADHGAHVSLEGRCGKGDLYGTNLTAADLQAISAHYDGGIRSADEHLGRFFGELRTLGLFDRALIVVTSDHGESLGERGVIGHGGLHLEELRVPLIMKFPAGWQFSPARVSEPAELVDLLPTLLGLCGARAPRDLDGRSLLPILFRGVRGKQYLLSQTSFEEAPEISSNPTLRSLLKPGRWQLVHDPSRARATFYALGHDPRGLTGVEVRGPEIPPCLDLLLERRREEPHPSRENEPVRFSPELERELLQLGYGGG